MLDILAVVSYVCKYLPMSTLAHDLHRLVRALDQSAEVRLAPFGLSYARYLALLMVRDHGGLTQRDLAGALGLSEPTASRTASALAAAGWLEITRTPGNGNRRELSATAEGRELVDRASEQLGGDFDEVVRAIDRDPHALAEDVRRLAAFIEESP